jgi:hypothetical protein
MGQRIGRVIADGSNVSQVVMEPLQLQEQRTEIAGASRNVEVQKRFHGLTVSQAVPYGRISGYALCEWNRRIECLLLEQFFDPPMFPKVADFELHDRLARDRETEMAWFNDAGMDRSDWHFEDAFPLDVAKAILTLLTPDGLIPQGFFPQGMSSLRPVLMANQTPKIWMPFWNQSEKIPNLPLIPLRGVNGWSNRGEETVFTHEVYSQENPWLTEQGEQILDFVFVCEWTTIDGEQ